MGWSKISGDCGYCGQWADDIYVHWYSCEEYKIWQEESMAQVKELLGEDKYNAIMEAASNFDPLL